jgi:hypothetical protein
LGAIYASPGRGFSHPGEPHPRVAELSAKARFLAARLRVGLGVCLLIQNAGADRRAFAYDQATFCANLMECGIPDFKGKGRVAMATALGGWRWGPPLGSSKAGRILSIRNVKKRGGSLHSSAKSVCRRGVWLEVPQTDPSKHSSGPARQSPQRMGSSGRAAVLAFPVGEGRGFGKEASLSQQCDPRWLYPTTHRLLVTMCAGGHTAHL